MVDGILEEYNNIRPFINQEKNVNLSPLLEEFYNNIKIQNDKHQYNILTILTPGKIDDMKKTISIIIKLSMLPVSIVIIGMGNSNFEFLKTLDSDNDDLINNEGYKTMRDIVQFVPFLKNESNKEKLNQELFDEIPQQILDYYENNEMDPLLGSF